MRRADFHTGIRAAVGLFTDLKLLYTPYCFTSLEPSPAFRKAAYDPHTRYTAVYLTGLESRDYNVLLSDFSYLQFYRSENSIGVDLRYAFYPNPFEVITYDEFKQAYDVGDAEGDGYELYLQMLDEMEDVGRAPPVRYDLSFSQYRELVHPTSHLHFGLHEENRWPVRRILTPDAFSLMIAKQFYLGAWVHRCESRPPIGEIGELEHRLSAAKNACEQLPDDFFSPLEEQQFHWT